jgi:uncharacterized protein (TIGR04141 family)
MKTKSVSLTVFRLHDFIDGAQVKSFDDYLADPSLLRAYDLADGHSFHAKLYVSEPEEKEPAWAAYLRNGFPDLPTITNIMTNRALLIIRTKYGTTDIHFAFPFGFGRYLLKSSSYVRNFGVKVALNAIYKGHPKKRIIDTNLIQSIDTKTVSANTMHTRRQSNRKATFETFGVDVYRDILRSITGRPLDQTEWGTRVSGSDALTINCPLDFKELGDRCGLIEELHLKKDYQEYFSWIDNIRIVTDPHLKEELEVYLRDSLRKKEVENVELAPPDIVDWDRIAEFQFSFGPNQTPNDLELDSLLAALESEGKLADLSIKQLKSTYRIDAVDSGGNTVGSWNALQCLSGELAYNNRTYILEGNDFFAVDDRFRQELDRYIGSLREYGRKLLKCKARWCEDKYNTEMGKKKEYLLLHKQDVRLPGKTSPIEVCDLLSDDKCFIHVKPKFSSSTLSHLFSQGYVSGELLCSSPDFRRKTLKAIEKALSIKTKKTTAPLALLRNYATFEAESISPQEYTVVYAVIGDWKDKGFKDKLPFFSKINLRKCADDLRRFGFQVCCKRIQKP